MSTWHQFSERLDQENVLPPTACPVCKSRDLTTTSKTVTSASYWRCRACGEVWNAERVAAATGFGPRFRYGSRRG